MADASFRTVKDSISDGFIVLSGLLNPSGALLPIITPSITTNGSFLADREEPPRIRIEEEEPGCPVEEATDTPATLPINISWGLTCKPRFFSSGLMAITEPVASFFLTVPYPITTTFSNIWESSARIIFISEATGNSCILYPINETEIISPLEADNRNLPSISVTVPFVVPFIITFAPITGSPVGSFTTPVTVICWAKTETDIHKPAISINSALNLKRFMCLNLSSLQVYLITLTILLPYRFFNPFNSFGSLTS